MVKTLVCWAGTFGVNGTKSLNGDIKYSLEISLMDLVIQSVGPNHFSKELLKYIFMKLDFINI